MEIESLDELAALLAGPAPVPAGVCLQDLDLTGSPRLADRLAAAQAAGLVVLGGRYPPDLLQTLADGGATVLPSVPGVPFQPYRAQLYRPGELYAGLQNGYHATVDAGCYRWFSDRRKVPDIAGATFAAIHDASITDALEDLLGPEERPLVAVMGGHGVQRGSDSYFSAAHLGSLLARCGALVATGGGPGAMEAVNLGAAVAGRGREDLPEIVGRLSAVPTFQDVAAWAAVALDVVDQLDHDTHEDPGTVASIGIPTWFYGHEPPNAFADRIAKYFSNALREDVLLARAGGGVIVLPGAAGTVQEIFQAATRSYYATDAAAPPIVLVDADHWTRTLPVWPLLHELAADRPMRRRITLCRNGSDAVAALIAMGVPLHPPAG